MNVRSAAARVQSFLARHAEMNGLEPECLLALDGNRYVLRASDLRALVAAAATQEEDTPFTWYVWNGAMWHANCHREISPVRVGKGRYAHCVLRCECGEQSR